MPPRRSDRSRQPTQRAEASAVATTGSSSGTIGAPTAPSTLPAGLPTAVTSPPQPMAMPTIESLEDRLAHLRQEAREKQMRQEIQELENRLSADRPPNQLHPEINVEAPIGQPPGAQNIPP